MKTLFTAQSVHQAIEDAKVAPKAKRQALTTPLGSSIVKGGKITETSQLDFILIAGLGLAEGNMAHVNQLKGLADMAGIKVTAGRIRHHIKTNEVVDITSDGIVSVSGKMKDYFQETIKSVGFASLVTLFSEELAVVIGIEQAVWARLTKEEQGDKYLEDHDSALVMNAPKKAARKARK